MVARRRKLSFENQPSIFTDEDASEGKAPTSCTSERMKVSFDEWPPPISDGTNSIAIRGKGVFEVPREVAEAFYDILTENYGLYTRAVSLSHVVARPSGEEFYRATTSKGKSRTRRKLK